jgi:hypothetical protein
MGIDRLPLPYCDVQILNKICITKSPRFRGRYGNHSTCMSQEPYLTLISPQSATSSNRFIGPSNFCMVINLLQSFFCTGLLQR